VAEAGERTVGDAHKAEVAAILEALRPALMGSGG